MKIWRYILCLLALMLALPVLAENVEESEIEDEWAFVDLGVDMLIVYNDVKWDFPIDITDMDPELVRLANKQFLLDSKFVPDDLVTMKKLKLNKDGTNANGGVRQVDATWQLQAECAAALVELCDAARAEGHELYLKSGYRSYSKQATMYSNRLEKYGYDDGWVAKPGSSDHQTGLGCDVVPKKWTDRGMNEDMAKEPETQWMGENCARFGFILRYPEDKQDVTEINYEPWHLRYVGKEVAAYIMDNGLCLEEFHQELQAAIDNFLANGGDASLVEDLIQVSAKDKYAK